MRARKGSRITVITVISLHNLHNLSFFVQQGERIPPEADVLETPRQQPAVHVCVLTPRIVPWHFVNGPLMVLKV